MYQHISDELPQGQNSLICSKHFLGNWFCINSHLQSCKL